MSIDHGDEQGKPGAERPYRPPSREPAPGPVVEAPTFDPEEALRRCFDNPELVQEMVRSLFDEADRLLEEMRQATAGGDAAALARAAHRLKGTVVYLGARPTADAARRVEQAGASGDLPAAAGALHELETELMRLLDVLLDHQRRRS